MAELIHDDILEVLISEKKIRARVRALGARITQDYAGKTPFFLGVLKGSYVFMADLTRCVALPCTMDFMAVSSGVTLSYLKGYLGNRKPASLRIVTLLDKPARRRADITADYCGFTVPDEFVVGYGLDFAERYRNLPYIGILKPEIYSI